MRDWSALVRPHLASLRVDERRLAVVASNGGDDKTPAWVHNLRQQPTVEVEVTLESGILGRAAVPSGASTGAFEADVASLGGKAAAVAPDGKIGEWVEKPVLQHRGEFIGPPGGCAEQIDQWDHIGQANSHDSDQGDGPIPKCERNPEVIHSYIIQHPIELEAHDHPDSGDGRQQNHLDGIDRKQHGAVESIPDGGGVRIAPRLR